MVAEIYGKVRKVGERTFPGPLHRVVEWREVDVTGPNVSVDVANEQLLQRGAVETFNEGHT